MDIIPRLIRDYNLALYAVCVVAFVYFAFTGLAAMRQLQRATFRLERQTETARAIGAWVRAALCVLLAVAVNVVSSLAPPTPVPTATGLQPTRTPNIGVPPTSLPTAQVRAITGTQPLTGTVAVGAAGTPRPGQPAVTPTATRPPATPGPTVAAQPTPTVASSPSPAPTAVPVAPANCGAPEARIAAPAVGERVAGPYTIRGTAVVEGGGYYKVEVLVPGAAQWSFINRGDQTVRDGALVQNFNFSALAPGNYPLRLVIIKPDSNIGAVCQIQIVVG